MEQLNTFSKCAGTAELLQDMRMHNHTFGDTHMHRHKKTSINDSMHARTKGTSSEEGEP